LAKKKRETADEEKELVEDVEEDEELAPLARTPEFFKTYATRTIPFMTEFDIRVVLANETMGDDEGWCIVADGMILLTPLAAKELAAELTEMVAAWEELHGKIKGRKGRRIVTTFSREGG
jgi:hypothetical protein